MMDFSVHFPFFLLTLGSDVLLFNFPVLFPFSLPSSSERKAHV